MIYMRVRVLVKKKEGVLDIEGKAIAHALKNLHVGHLGEVTKGTFVELEFNGKKEDVKAFVEEACHKLLVNDVIETFEYEILN